MPPLISESLFSKNDAFLNSKGTSTSFSCETISVVKQSGKSLFPIAIHQALDLFFLWALIFFFALTFEGDLDAIDVKNDQTQTCKRAMV